MPHEERSWRRHRRLKSEAAIKDPSRLSDRTDDQIGPSQWIERPGNTVPRHGMPAPAVAMAFLCQDSDHRIRDSSGCWRGCGFLRGSFRRASRLAESRAMSTGRFRCRRRRFRLRSGQDEGGRPHTASPGPCNLLSIGKAATLLPALIGRTTPARTILARKGAGGIFVLRRRPTDWNRNHRNQ